MNAIKTTPEVYIYIYCDINLDPPPPSSLGPAEERSVFTGHGCLNIHPSTNTGSVLAKISVYLIYILFLDIECGCTRFR